MMEDTRFVIELENDGSRKIIDLHNGKVTWINKDGIEFLAVDKDNKAIKVLTTADGIRKYGMIGDIRRKLMDAVSWKEYCESEFGIKHVG